MTMHVLYESSTYNVTLVSDSNLVMIHRLDTDVSGAADAQRLSPLIGALSALEEVAKRGAAADHKSLVDPVEMYIEFFLRKYRGGRVPPEEKNDVESNDDGSESENDA